MQIGTQSANAIRASRITTLHRQAVYKTANPLNIHTTESCFPGDDHVSFLKIHEAYALRVKMRAGHFMSIYGAANSHAAKIDVLSERKAGSRVTNESSWRTITQCICGMNPNRVASAILGLIHRHISPIKNVILACYIAGKDNDADTRGAVMFDG